jgi:hypothetical protein
MPIPPIQKCEIARTAPTDANSLLMVPWLNPIVLAISDWDFLSFFIRDDSSGKLLHKWGKEYPGAHGLSLVKEGEREVLYFTDLVLNKVFKATTTGEILDEWGFPEASGKYKEAKQYKPSWTLHHPEGGFYVLDGYGLDYISHYDAKGKYEGIIGGKEILRPLG